jgi:SHS2 domain-containing protein
MPFEYVEDAVTSDVTFHAWGSSLAELFAAAVDALTNTMVADLETVHPETQKQVEVEAETLDILLLRLLEEVVFLKDSDGLLLRAGQVQVDADGPPRRVRAALVGERIDRERHELVADVKAVTLYGLRVERADALWDAHVTLDV